MTTEQVTKEVVTAKEVVAFVLIVTGVVAFAVALFLVGSDYGYSHTNVRCDECKCLKQMRYVNVFKQKQSAEQRNLETEEDVVFVCKSCQDKIINEKIFPYKK